MSGDFGRRLPLDRRQPGTPASPAAAAAAAAASSGRENGATPSSLPLEESVDLPENGGKPADDGSTTRGDVNTDSKASLVSPQAKKSDGGAVVKDGATGELWWRYEHLGEGVVVKGKGRAETRSGASGPATGASASRKTEEGGVGVEKTSAASLGEAATTEETSAVGSGGGGGRTEEEVMVRVNCPIRVLDPKHGVYQCHPLGKEAQTVGRWVGHWVTWADIMYLVCNYCRTARC